jgi:Asp-tRNA(Asn)/Glu-tRNA(Gln) amidotransferase C subunit
MSNFIEATTTIYNHLTEERVSLIETLATMKFTPAHTKKIENKIEKIAECQEKIEKLLDILSAS